MYVIERVLDALEVTIQDIITENDDAVIKVFPGFSIEVKTDSKKRQSNLLKDKTFRFLYLKGKFSKRFKDKIQRAKKLES